MVDPIIRAWRSAHDPSTTCIAVFHHGTCVVVPPGVWAPAGHAAAMLRLHGPVGPEIDTRAFGLERRRDLGGWIVTHGEPEIMTFVEDGAVRRGWFQWRKWHELDVRLHGRIRRGLDARELGLVRLGGRGIDDDDPDALRATAWGALLGRSDSAARSGSHWVRYGLSHDAVETRTTDEAGLSPPPLPREGAPRKILSIMRDLEKAIAEAGSLPGPCEAWIGLVPERLAGRWWRDGDPDRDRELEGDGNDHEARSPLPAEVFSPGGHVSLSGFVSASLDPAPALVAAGHRGALLRVRLSVAMPVVGCDAKPGEKELLLPRNSDFLVRAVVPDARIDDGSGYVWERTVVVLEQVPVCAPST
jgi:hypothetical protein